LDVVIADSILLFSLAALFWGGSTLGRLQALMNNPGPNPAMQISLSKLRRFR
jgi:hypothetical protein